MKYFYFLLSTLVLLPVLVSGRRFYITGKGICADCGYHGYDYQWCWLGPEQQDWDHCSTKPGYTRRDEKCRKDHSCGKHGYNYLWCFKEGGGWDYCSLVEDTSLNQFAKNGEECQNYCDLSGESGENEMYRCMKPDRNFADCSPSNGVTANGVGCFSMEAGNGENSCGPHITRNNWCWTSEKGASGTWGYCSNPQEDSSAFDSPSAREICDGPNVIKMHRTYIWIRHFNNGRRLVTAMYHGGSDSTKIRNATATSKQEESEALAAIYRWNVNARAGNSAEKSYEDDPNQNVILDGQGISETKNYGHFNQWRLILNGDYDLPTSVAIVNIQVALDRSDLSNWKRIFVTALHESLRRAATVWVFQQWMDNSLEFIECPRHMK